MTLQELLEDVCVEKSWGDLATAVKGVGYDSRRLRKGDLFVALPGSVVDGHRFIDGALRSGAAAIVAERPPEAEPPVPWVVVESSRKALGRVAARWFGNPSHRLTTAGITGTNGKTTTAFLLQHLNDAAQRRCGLIGTVRYETGARVVEAAHTTPESADIHELLREMEDHGCRAVSMEVSSHGLVQYRVEGVEFDVAVFTNLSQDHLDYHGDMESYFASKRRLFEGLRGQREKSKPVPVVNGDDVYGKRLLAEMSRSFEVLSFGFGVANGFRASKLRSTFDGVQFQLDALGRQTLVRLPLIGSFNVLNALAALAAAKGMGLNVREAVGHLQHAPQVPGRMERVGEGGGYRVFVDYAHTPDALEKACLTLRELKPERLITVFGCGGDRDRSKRPLMAAAAASASDVVFLTSDNPRTEDPAAILRDAEAGLGGCSSRSIPDRREAIREAIELAKEGDLVLIAGKGHETYQQVGTEKFDFDDREVARECMRSRGEER